jgi:hypothetical protein
MVLDTPEGMSARTSPERHKKRPGLNRGANILKGAGL